MYSFESDNPIERQDTGNLTTGSLSAAAPDAQPISMLLVEDNADDVMLTRRMFRAAAPHVTLVAVTHGQEAFDKVASGHYDVAVVDYVLPDLSGLEVLHVLLAQDLPVIMVTGRGDERTAVQALKAGAADYLVKDSGYLRRLPQAVLGAVERSRLSRENRQLAEQTEAQRAWLQTVVDQMPLSVYIAAANGDTLLMNRAGIEMFGNPPRSLKTPNMAAPYGVIYPDGTPVPQEDLPTTRALAKEETIIGLEMRARTPDGRTIDTLTNASPLYDNKGRLIAAISVSQDITRLRDIDRMKDEFMSIAGHELRTPLTNMKAAAQLVLRRAKQDQYPWHELSLINTIVQQSERMARLIEGLLDVSRLQTGRLEIQKQPFDLSALAREVVEHSRLSNPGFAFELRANGQVWIDADRDRIAQVLGNLLDNSVKYGAQEGNGKAEVFVENVPGEKMARVEVKDNGMGFEPSQNEQIFERFSRLGSVNHHSRGMGLGLFICRQIIAAHGGTIVAHSPGPGQGATFTITLPLGEL